MNTSSPVQTSPDPSGRPRPSGMILTSQAAISSGSASRPSPYSPGHTAVAVALTVSPATSVNLRNFDILCLPIGPHPPCLNTVVVIDRVFAAHLAQLRLGGLDIAGVVHRPALQQHLLAVPIGVEIEARERLGLGYRGQTRGLPRLAAVLGDIDAGNGPMARPCKPGDHQRPLAMGDRRLR